MLSLEPAAGGAGTGHRRECTACAHALQDTTISTALIVLGYHQFADDGSHGISAICRAGVRRAEQLATDLHPAAVVFTGWSSTGGASEAEQMRRLWRTAGPDLLVDPCATNTAENAAYSLRLLLDHGGIEAVTVVCAIRHAIRVPFFFGRLFRAHGLRVDYDFVWRPFPLPSVWLQEAGGLALMLRHRRHAEALFGQLSSSGVRERVEDTR